MRAVAARTICPVREEPSSNMPLDDELLYGMCVEVLGEVPDREEGERVLWLHIRTAYHYEGYCRKEELLTGNARVETWERGRQCVVMQPFADVLASPGVRGVCMESVTRGGRLVVAGEQPDKEGWILVELVDGRRGYTREGFLAPVYEQPFTDQEEVFRRRLVELAKGYLGTQYRWGGKTPLGIDCSGLTSMCYMLCGVYIYRNASIKEGFPVREISFEEKAPGDLLYFPGHIAMYIGDDRYIHSTGRRGSDGVVINSLNPAHEDYREDLRRILEHTGSIFSPRGQGNQGER